MMVRSQCRSKQQEMLTLAVGVWLGEAKLVAWTDRTECDRRTPVVTLEEIRRLPGVYALEFALVLWLTWASVPALGLVVVCAHGSRDHEEAQEGEDDVEEFHDVVEDFCCF